MVIYYSSSGVKFPSEELGVGHKGRDNASSDLFPLQIPIFGKNSTLTFWALILPLSIIFMHLIRSWSFPPWNTPLFVFNIYNTEFHCLPPDSSLALTFLISLISAFILLIIQAQKGLGGWITWLRTWNVLDLQALWLREISALQPDTLMCR